MYSSNATLYPMLGVGAFVSMFWTGVVLGSELGVGCAAMLILGLLCACIAAVGVCELQRRDGRGEPPADATAPGTPRPRQPRTRLAAPRAGGAPAPPLVLPAGSGPAR